MSHGHPKVPHRMAGYAGLSQKSGDVEKNERSGGLLRIKISQLVFVVFINQSKRSLTVKHLY